MDKTAPSNKPQCPEGTPCEWVAGKRVERCARCPYNDEKALRELMAGGGPINVPSGKSEP